MDRLMRIDLTIHKGDGGASASALSLSLSLCIRGKAHRQRGWELIGPHCYGEEIR